MTLAILICTLPDRVMKLRRLLAILDPQVKQFQDKVFYRIHDGGRSMPTGTKRNQLITQTQSDYFVFIDDDDLISNNYVAEIIKASEVRPDVITFRGWMTTNGHSRAGWTIRLGSTYEERNGHYYRWPNHIVPVRREAVHGIWFPDVWIQEDYRWSKAVRDAGALKSEVHIDKELYHYDFQTKPRKHRVK